MGHRDVKIRECGLFIHPSHIFIAGSPDGIISCSCCEFNRVLEIKCPFKCAGKDPNKEVLDCLTVVQGKPRLKRNHQYYSQIQTQMSVTKEESAIFVIWSNVDIFVEEIKFDSKYFDVLLKNCIYFFDRFVLKFFKRDLRQDSDTDMNVEVNMTDPEPSTSKRVVRKRRKVLESKPIYVCFLCEKECLQVEDFRNEEDESVQCDSCRLWCHIICTNYVENNENSKWMCPLCEQMN